MAASILCLGVFGGGWSVKPTPPSHALYGNERFLIAHRGAADQLPENTVAAASRASRLGFKGIEIDIKESGDQRFYLFHDKTGERLFHETLKLKDLNLQQLQQLPLYHQGKPTGHRVPGLESFATHFADSFIFYIDVKRHGNDNYRYLAKKIVSFLDRHQLTERAYVGSDFLFTAYLEYRFPKVHTVFTGPGNSSARVYRWIPTRFRPDFIISYAREITPEHLDWLRKHHLMHRRMLYGVDSGNYKEVRSWGIPKLLVDYHPIMDRDLAQ